MPLEQGALAGRIRHPPADQISFEDRVEGSLFGLGRYPVDTSPGIRRIAIGCKSRIHMSNEARPSISIERGKDVNLGLLRRFQIQVDEVQVSITAGAPCRSASDKHAAVTGR